MRGVGPLYRATPQLASLLGKSEVRLSEAVKDFWVYVKSNKLQDPENGRRILSNPEMKNIFGVDMIEFTQVSKHLRSHMTKKE